MPATNKLQEFFSAFLAYSKWINDATIKINEVKNLLVEELKSQGIDLSTNSL